MVNNYNIFKNNIVLVNVLVNMLNLKMIINNVIVVVCIMLIKMLNIVHNNVQMDNIKFQM